MGTEYEMSIDTEIEELFYEILADLPSWADIAELEALSRTDIVD